VESRSVLESVVPHDAPVAQLDRACASEAQGRVFESLRAHHFLSSLSSATSDGTSLHFELKFRSVRVTAVRFSLVGLALIELQPVHYFLSSELQCLFISWAALACSHFRHVLGVRTLSAAVA
jgi:hypothetical protein